MSVFTRPKNTKPGERKHWHYSFSVRGVRYRGSIPEARIKTDAEEAENKIKREIFEGRFGSIERGEQLLSDFVEKVYLPWARQNKRSWDHDEFRARAMCASASLKGKTFAEISPLLIEKLKRERASSLTMHGTTRSPGTVNAELTVLSRIMSMAVDNKLISDNPCRKVKFLHVAEGPTSFLTDEDETKLLDKLTGRRAYLRPIIILALYTGMRENEVLRLEWPHVDFVRNRLFVMYPKWKNDPRRTKGIPMSSLVRQTLLERRAESQGQYIFPGGHADGRLCRSSVLQAFQRACADAGLPAFRFHDLRHTFGTRLAESDVSPFKIAELMGHSNIKQTGRYVHPSDGGKEQAVEALVGARPKACHNGRWEDCVRCCYPAHW